MSQAVRGGDKGVKVRRLARETTQCWSLCVTPEVSRRPPRPLMDGDTFGMNQDGHSWRQAVSEVRVRVLVEVTRERGRDATLRLRVRERD